MAKKGSDSMKNYERIAAKKISELKTAAVLYHHKKSGAKLLTMKNDDINRVFAIAFRTTPKDSTGVAHIMEHSVLCGSGKFPLKDPFVELAKGSLNTFLNAMTYPDKTVYPIASTNEKDFRNLMDVYLDAVLHPNCVTEKKTFQQEGWHYEISSEQEELSYNGVVYNEMKGAFSSPESVLERAIMHSLFPDTTYGNESGGDPEQIPSLSYEQFCEFHAKYYHPSNAYIILYGDLDMEKEMGFIDREYLSAYDAMEVDSAVGVQKPFSRMRRESLSYPLAAEESPEKKDYLSYNMVLHDALDPKRNLAFSILDYALLGAPGAPLKQALLDAGIGEDILGGFADGILQPYFSITAKNVSRAQEKRFKAVIDKTLKSLVREGLDKKTLESAIAHQDFEDREADFGRTPKGLVYALTTLDSWLYGGEPWTFLENQKYYQELREEVQTGYFERLMEENLLGNKHASLIVLGGEPGLNEKTERERQEKLQAWKSSLSRQALKALVQETRELHRYQEEENSKEALETLPMLRREDLGEKASHVKFEEMELGSHKLLFTELPSRGIVYLNLQFNTAGLTEEELRYASLLRNILSYMNTGKHSYRDLSSTINLETGGISFSITAFPDLRRENHYTGFFTVHIKLLKERLSEAFSLADEILNTTAFEDEKRMLEILQEQASREKMGLQGASHVAALTRSMAGFSATARYQELTSGIDYCHFVDAQAKGYPEHKEEFTRKLHHTVEKLFSLDRLFIALGAEKDGLKAVQKSFPDFLESFARNQMEQKLLFGVLSKDYIEGAGDPEGEGQLRLFPLEKEGFTSAQQVNFVARSGKIDLKKHPYTGTLRVLKPILNLEYLWQRLRVKGGAYGCMSGFTRSGNAYLVSYRDPNLRNTMKVYENLPAYLKHFDCPERELLKYIIGAVAELDTPKTLSMRLSAAVGQYFTGVSEEMIDRERKEVLECRVEDIRALEAYVRDLLKTGAAVTIGNEQAIRSEEKMFDRIESLF